MLGSRNFHWGVQVSLTKKGLTFFFLVLNSFYRSLVVNFQRNLSFFKVPEGSNIFQWGGGPTFSRRGPIAYSL